MMQHKEILFDELRQVLKVVQNQDFESPQHKQEVEKYLLSTIFQLSDMGEALAIRTVIFESHRGILSEKFSPPIVSQFKITKSVVGFVDGPGEQKIPVIRYLLGRTYATDNQNGSIEVTEYFRPDGEDPNLFKVAIRHNGLSGLEGAVTTAIPRKQAEVLLFSGVTRNGSGASK